MKCSSCYASVAVNDRFCGKCGERIATDPQIQHKFGAEATTPEAAHESDNRPQTSAPIFAKPIKTPQKWSTGSTLMVGMGALLIMCFVAIAAATVTVLVLVRQPTGPLAGSASRNANERETPANQLEQLAVPLEKENISEGGRPDSAPDASQNQLVTESRVPDASNPTPLSVTTGLFNAIAEDADKLVLQGREAVAKGDHLIAIDTFQQAIELDPEHYAAHMNLGHVLQQANNYRRAAECFHKASELNPRDGLAPFCEASALALAGELDQAIARFEHAIGCNPILPEPYNALGEALYARFLVNQSLGNKDRHDLLRAVQCFYRAVAMAPDERIYRENFNWGRGHLTDSEKKAWPNLAGQSNLDRFKDGTTPMSGK